MNERPKKPNEKESMSTPFKRLFVGDLIYQATRSGFFDDVRGEDKRIDIFSKLESADVDIGGFAEYVENEDLVSIYEGLDDRTKMEIKNILVQELKKYINNEYESLKERVSSELEKNLLFVRERDKLLTLAKRLRDDAEREGKKSAEIDMLFSHLPDVESGSKDQDSLPEHSQKVIREFIDEFQQFFKLCYEICHEDIVVVKFSDEEYILCGKPIAIMIAREEERKIQDFIATLD